MATTICEILQRGSLVAQVLAEVGKVGIGKFIFRDGERPVLLSSKGRRLKFYRLPNPVRIRGDLDVPATPTRPPPRFAP